MRFLVIYAHPVEDSYQSAIHRCVVAALTKAGHEVDDCDLYAEGFQPVLTRKERIDYHDVTINRAIAPRDVERLQRCQGLVFVFPTWWYGMPAILKGYFDRVWATGVAFRLKPGGGGIEPGLDNIEKMWVVTTYGAPRWLIRLVLRDPVRAVIIGGLSRLCRRRVATRFLALYNIDAAIPARCARFLTHVERAFSRF
jgi:putative NADPH-quinone reductase